MTKEPGENFSYPLVRALSEQNTVFSGLFGFSSTTFGPPDAVERTRGAWVTGSYYETFGVQPVAGRLLEPGDDRPNGMPVEAVPFRA